MPSPRAPDPRPLTGEPLSLDLLNTVWLDAEGEHDLLDTEEGMTLWLALHGLDGPTHTRARATLIQTRETLRAFLADQLETDARESVNAILRRGAERPVFAGKALVTEIEGSPGWRAPWRAARDLIALHAEYPGRIRSCANPDCPLYFLDTSRPGTRRWCSMSVCGNRDKTRRHYQRHH